MQRRFARACRGLKLPLEGATLLVACSGGVDSAAALALLRRAAPQSRLIACYIDHGLRPALAIRRDIAAVRDQARAANAEVCVRRVTAPLGRGSLEEQARIVRYALLADVAQEKDARFVIAGQHSDDVAESLLLALIRGSGLDGVAAMPAKRVLSASVMLVRPLLWADRSALQAFVETLGVRVSEDETNADVRLRRNAVRALLAAVERVMPGTRGNIARAARLLRGDKALLAVYTARAWRRCKSEKHAGLETRLLRTLPLPLLRRVIRYAIVAGCGSARNFSFQHCNAIARAIHAGRGGSYHAGPARVLLSAGKLSIEAPNRPARHPLPEEPSPEMTLRARKPASLATPLGTLRMQIVSDVWPKNGRARPHEVLWLDYSQLRGSRIRVRLPQPGDKCTPSGRRSPISLARFLAKAGVPRAVRHAVPLLCAENRIVAALPLRVMEPYTARAGAPILELRWRPIAAADNKSNGPQATEGLDESFYR